MIRDLLPVLDNFDRGLEHAEEGDEFHKGMALIYKQLFDVLQRHGVKPITESGVRFDPNIHEGVVREEDASVPSHTVVAVMQKGYFLHDRLIRPAMVKVAVGGPEEDRAVRHRNSCRRSSESISGRRTPASRSSTSPRRR